MRFNLLFASVLLSITVSKAQTNYPAGITDCIARWDFKNILSNQISDVSGNKFSGFYQGDCQTSNIIYKGVSYYTPGNWSMHITDGLYDGNCSVYNASKMQLDFAGASSVSYTVPTNNYVAINTWYFMATTYDGAIVKRYMVEMDSNNQQNNIVPISSTILNSILGSNTNNLIIGATQNASYPFNVTGAIDEVALFNRSLSELEITKIYKYLWGQTLGLDNAYVDTLPRVSIENGILQIKSYRKNINLSIIDVFGRQILSASQVDLTGIYDLSTHRGEVIIVRINDCGKNYNIKTFVGY